MEKGQGPLAPHCPFSGFPFAEEEKKGHLAQKPLAPAKTQSHDSPGVKETERERESGIELQHHRERNPDQKSDLDMELQSFLKIFSG